MFSIFSKPTCKKCGQYLYEKDKKQTITAAYFGRSAQRPIAICSACGNVVCAHCVHVATEEKHDRPFSPSRSVCPVCKADETMKFYDDHKGKKLSKYYN
jgi:hypothetical protein